MRKTEWTKEKLQEEVNKYKTRKEFRSNSRNAYLTALNNKMMEELFKNHINNGYCENRKLNGYWTKEKLQEEANKYETVGEFLKNNKKAYDISHRKKILNDLFKNHTNLGRDENRNPKNYWTEENLQKEANKYKTINEFIKNNASAYNIALHNKILVDLFKNHINNGYNKNRKLNGYWSNENLQLEVDKYKTRYEFRKNNYSAHSQATRHNLLDELFKNKINNGYSDNEEWIENRYFIYAYELKEFNKAYIGLTNNIERRDKEHLFNEKTALSIFCKENNLSFPEYKILEKDLTSTEAQKQEKYWEGFYKDNGCEMFNISKTGGLGFIKIKWTKKALQEEANKYETRGDFQKYSSVAYGIALNKKLIDKLFINHINNGYSEKQQIKGYWAEEVLQKEVNKYQTRAELKKNNVHAYTAACVKKLINELFKNHINNGYKNKNISH